MTNKCGPSRQMTNNLRDELIWGMNSASELATVYYHTRTSITGGSQSTPPGDKAWCINAPIEWCSGYRHFQCKKRKSCDHRCPDSLFFSHAVVNYIFECCGKTYLSKRNELNRVYFLRFCTKYNTWFSKYRIELIVALSLTNATKTILQRQVLQISS